MPRVYVDSRIGELPIEPQSVIRELAQEVNVLAGYVFVGAGSPAGKIFANRGSLYLRTDGGVGTSLYVKESGDGLATGWAAK
jgi:hypothetical protein